MVTKVLVHVFIITFIENVFSIKSWCRDKFNVEENVINKQFAVPEDLDYIA